MNGLCLHHQNKLFRYLLSADYYTNTDLFLSDLLNLLINSIGAKKGYIEINYDRDKMFWAQDNYGKRELDDIRKVISEGIISIALDKKEVIKTNSAISDPRFLSRESVRNAQIEAVICFPFNSAEIKGVVYLQGDMNFHTESDNVLEDIRLVKDKMIPVLSHICRKRTDEQRNNIHSLRKRFNIKGIVGKSSATEAVLRRVLKVAPLDINVMLTGKTGTGKSLFAEIIHRNSKRKDKPFVEVNCAALPENLVENELFGSLQGGHSSAIKPVTGKVGAAEGGTLFLDEIGELSVSVQAKLLHFIQSGRYYPLGASKQVESDVRIITATNVNLKQAIKKKKFREDLFFRINVFSIEIPPLSQRKGDVSELALYFCRKCCERYGFEEMVISSSSLGFLNGNSWKGNVRELKHTIETAVINAVIEGDQILKPEHFRVGANGFDIEFPIEDFKKATQLFQKEYIKSNLEIRNWNISKTAKDISISRSQLNNLIKAFQLNRKRAHDISSDFFYFDNSF